MTFLKKALIVVGVTLGCSLFGFLLIGLLQFVFPSEGLENVYLLKVILIIGHLTTFVLSSVLLANIFSKSTFIKYAPFVFKIDGILFLKLFLLMLLSYPIAGITAGLSSQLDLPDWMVRMDGKNVELLKQLMNMDHFFDFIINLGVIAILPGIGEEMLFRGVLQNELQKSMTNRYLPLVIAALVFAAFHLEPTGLITKFIIGCVLGYAYMITKNIFYPMLIHAINNGVQVFIIYFTNGMDDLNINIPPPDVAQWIAAFTTLPMIYYLIKHLNQDYLWIKS